MSSSDARHVDLDLAPEAALEVLRQAVEASGGGWNDAVDPPQLLIPVRAGLRRGFLRAAATAEQRSGGSRVSVGVREEVLRLDVASFVVLLFGAAGGVVMLLWPLYPALLALAPVGAILGLAAWLLVASRFRSWGLGELLALVADGSRGDEPDDPD